MAKKKSRKGKGSYATYKAESRLDKNRARKLAKHLAKHPADKQAEVAVGKPARVRKASRGNACPAQKHYWYDGAGQKHLMPSFTTFKGNK